MESLLKDPLSLSAINLGPPCTVGPAPASIAPNAQPVFFVCDAAMVDLSDHFYPQNPTSQQHAQMLAMARLTSTPIIHITPDLEIQILDSFKEEQKKIHKATPGTPLITPNLRNWCWGSEGRGIVKSYPLMRSSSFAHQYLIYSQARLEGVQMEHCFSDVRPNFRDKFPDSSKNPQYPRADRERLDLRIQAMVDGAEALSLLYPAAKFYFFLRGLRIAGRYSELKAANGVTALDHLGTVHVGRDCRTLRDADIKRHIEVSKNVTKTQPRSYPSKMPVTSRWSDLPFDIDGRIIIEPKFEPLLPIPRKVNTGSFQAIRIILDGCVLDGRAKDLLNFVGRFQGDVQMTSLPEVEEELGRGYGGRSRMDAWRKIMQRKKSTKVELEDVMPSFQPTVYGDDLEPVVGPHLRGDLAIRIQLSKVISTLERTMDKKKLLVLFVTEDYGCGELMRAVGGESAKYRCLRVDKGETGIHFQNILFDQIR